MNNETTATGIAPEMTIPDAVKIARQEAAKNTGEVRSALTMLADYAMPLIPHDEPAPGEGENAGSAEGEKCDTPPKFADLPELGISFRRFFSPRCIKLVAPWHDDANSHVYEISIRKWVTGDWCAILYNDALEVARLVTKSKWACERMASEAMRAYLIRGHRKTWRKARKAAKGAQA